VNKDTLREGTKEHTDGSKTLVRVRAYRHGRKGIPVHTDKVREGRGVAEEGGGKWCGRPGRQIPMGGKMNILNENNYFLRSTNFTLMSQIKENSVCDVFKVHTSCYGRPL
jgi:hypothetical protein